MKRPLRGMKSKIPQWPEKQRQLNRLKQTARQKRRLEKKLQTQVTRT